MLPLIHATAANAAANAAANNENPAAVLAAIGLTACAIAAHTAAAQT